MEKENLRILVVCKHPKYSREAKVCEKVLTNGFNIKYSWKNTLKKSDIENSDLIISIGGDGTALSASHYIFTRPLLAVNSSPKTSVGALTTITIQELEKKLEEIKSGSYKTEELERIEISINGKTQDPIALNEVFIASEKAHLVSKYKINFKGKTELQKSSGLIFSTGTGSTAWFKSAGGHPFSPQARYIKMRVREPFKGYKNPIHYSFLEETIHEGEEIKIVPLTKSVLAIDSIREFKLKPNDEIKIKISKYHLRRIH